MRVRCRWLTCGTFALWIGAGSAGADPVFGDAFMSRYEARSHSFLQTAPPKSNSDEQYCAHVLAGDTGPLPGALGLREVVTSLNSY